MRCELHVVYNMFKYVSRVFLHAIVGELKEIKTNSQHWKPWWLCFSKSNAIKMQMNDHQRMPTTTQCQAFMNSPYNGWASKKAVCNDLYEICGLLVNENLTIKNYYCK